MTASDESQLEVRLQAELEEIEDRVLVEETALLLARTQALLARGNVPRAEAQRLSDAQLRLGFAMVNALDDPVLREQWTDRLRSYLQ